MKQEVGTNHGTADEQVDPPALQAELPDRLEALDLHLADHPRAS